MPKLWIDKKLYSVEAEVRDYVEKLESDNTYLQKEKTKAYRHGYDSGYSDGVIDTKNTKK